MEDLDLLKKDWQKNNDFFKQVSENTIYKMIHKKSSSIVKWILIISILEVSLWTIINIFLDTDAHLEKTHPELIPFFKVVTYLNYVVVLVFIYLFYKNYIKISTTVATKQLMNDILKTRKTVQYYIWYNLLLSLLSFIVGIIIAISDKSNMILINKITIDDTHIIKALIILFLATAIFFGIFWLFYKLLYGLLLKKLNANYKELKKIDF
jgi:hypothetical protein